MASMAVFVLVLLYVSGHCSGLLVQPPTNDELYTMIQQLNASFVNQQSVGFYAWLSKDLQNIGNGRAIEFDHVLTNDGHAYDATHGRFTAPVNGMYLFSASVMSGGSNNIYCELVKNGVVFAHLYGAYSANAYTHTSVQNLQAGDTVLVRHATRPYASDDILHATYSYFSGFLIRKM